MFKIKGSTCSLAFETQLINQSAFKPHLCTVVTALWLNRPSNATFKGALVLYMASPNDPFTHLQYSLTHVKIGATPQPTQSKATPRQRQSGERKYTDEDICSKWSHVPSLGLRARSTTQADFKVSPTGSWKNTKPVVLEWPTRTLDLVILKF